MSFHDAAKAKSLRDHWQPFFMFSFFQVMQKPSKKWQSNNFQSFLFENREVATAQYWAFYESSILSNFKYPLDDLTKLMDFSGKREAEYLSHSIQNIIWFITKSDGRVFQTFLYRAIYLIFLETCSFLVSVLLTVSLKINL